jgi:hypothetical protein
MLGPDITAKSPKQGRLCPARTGHVVLLARNHGARANTGRQENVEFGAVAGESLGVATRRRSSRRRVMPRGGPYRGGVRVPRMRPADPEPRE